jgi:hypothetical protein
MPELHPGSSALHPHCSEGAFLRTEGLWKAVEEVKGGTYQGVQ